MGLAELTQGKKWKSFMAKLYGLGAAVVIVGAMFKIQHWAGAGLMLVLGLSTEAVIFFFSAFEPPHEDPDWSLVYPELAGMDSEHGKKHGSPVEELGNMLEEAKIGPELLESVGTGLRSLSETTSKLSSISDASVATTEYVTSIRAASSSISDLTQSYGQVTKAMEDLSGSSEELKGYSRQIQEAGKNLAALNAIYELQIQDANSQLKETSKFYEGLHEMMSNLNASLDDTKKYKEEVSQLADNLTSLNKVYGNMLSAMKA